MTADRPTCATRVAARHTPKLKVPCRNTAVAVDANGKGVCAHHASRKRVLTLPRAERDLLESVLATGEVDEALRERGLLLRRDAMRWEETP